MPRIEVYAEWKDSRGRSRRELVGLVSHRPLAELVKRAEELEAAYAGQVRKELAGRAA